VVWDARQRLFSPTYLSIEHPWPYRKGKPEAAGGGQIHRGVVSGTSTTQDGMANPIEATLGQLYELGQLVQQTVKGAETAISANSVNDLNNLPDGAAIDTYCGVDGNGQPLPAYFNTGKNTAFGATFLPLYTAVGNASSKADVLSILLTQKAKISTLASELAKLPTSIKATATAAVNNVEKIIATKNLALLGNGNGPASYLAMYCGQNE
jgi:hypothetical protein